MSDTRPWWLDELATAGRENLDPAHAAAYDSKEDAATESELLLLTRLGLGLHSSVVDIGAGTGQMVGALASRCARVVAVDVSPVMLARLQARVHAAGWRRVEIVQAGFLTYGHQGPPADFVYSRYALHHLPDFWKVIALRRVRGILRPGGVLRLWDVVYHFDPAAASARLEAWRASLPADGPGWTRADVDDHIRDEHSTFSWLLEPMLERNGFRIDDAAYSADGIFARYVARAV
jgi:SAM-dependent methyltransferase